MQFIQPTVVTVDGEEKLLDDVIGYRWAVLHWGGNPETLFTPTQRDDLRRLGAALVSLRPAVQCHRDEPQDPDAVVVGDLGRLKAWFDERPVSVLIVRPDRFIAAATVPQLAGRAVEAVARAVALRADAPVSAFPSTPGTATAPAPAAAPSPASVAREKEWA
ncbi:hypothetical protein [Microbacterium sp. B19]|uniref:hypothetical protein n=1 Tax=Microbacterium sp. B19 TaxID=96765 RepID=UPI0019553C6D|nr:hypothetical protein [Microbacterium sp. B19]